MKRLLFFMSLAASILTSCSKDEDVKAEYATESEMVGTWTFQSPAAADVVVKGSDEAIVKKMRDEFQGSLGKGYLMHITITFNADKTCDVTEIIDNNTHKCKGSYRVENGRLYFQYKDLVTTDQSPLETGLLEKRNGGILFVWDRQCLIEKLNYFIASPTDVSDAERVEYKESLKVLTDKITEVYIPFKLVKKQ